MVRFEPTLSELFWTSTIYFTFHYGEIWTLPCLIQTCTGRGFTYQYGEIWMFFQLFRKLRRVLFTFHYCEIWTKTGTAKPEGRSTLHSTMVRFEQYIIAWKRRGQGLYIPIWRDLNNVGIEFLETYSSFTFHYGEIWTGNVDHEYNNRQALHSTMVRFERSALVWTGDRRRSLHSTMVRFEPWCPPYSPQVGESLHSTMVRFERNKCWGSYYQWHIFTFHYGEIWTIVASNKGSNTCNFTFHYGEIWTLGHGYLNLCHYNFTFHYGEIWT